MAHALILGASGISGWSIFNQAQSYPTPTTFARITGTTNRPLSLEKAQFPSDDRLHLVSGIDFTKSVDEVVALLKNKIPDIDTVTHVFFTAYIHTNDFDRLREVNTNLIDVAVRAIEHVSPKLESVILQTGGKGYGLEFPDKIDIITPLRESHPRIPEPWASNIFYYTQHDRLAELSRGKSWTFTEVRPDGIIGFAPGYNAMNLAQGVGLYLTVYRAALGQGAEVAFPGNERGYWSKHTDTFQDILSRFEIFAALNRDRCGEGAAFNVADGEAVSWAEVWPRLAEHFGLVGTGPAEKQDASGITARVTIEEFVKQHRDVWVSLAEKHGLRTEVLDEQNWAFVHFMLVQFDFDRQYDLTKIREIGFDDKIDTVDGYKKAWQRMRDAKILPPL